MADKKAKNRKRSLGMKIFAIIMVLMMLIPAAYYLILFIGGAI